VRFRHEDHFGVTRDELFEQIRLAASFCERLFEALAEARG